MDIDNKWLLICLDDFLNLWIKQLNKSVEAVLVIGIISDFLTNLHYWIYLSRKIILYIWFL